MMSGRRIHDARPSMTLSASRPPTPTAITPSASTCGVWLSVPTQRVRERDAVLRVNHRRHSLQVDLVHDAVARRNHVDVLEREPGPVDEVKAVLVATVLDRAVLVERIGIESAALDGQRMVDDQLHRHHGIDLRRIAALLGDRIPQAREVDERGLAEDVVADDARRKPREIQVALALDRSAAGEASRIAGSQRRTRFSACTRAVYDSLSYAPGSMASTAARASK